MAKRKKRAQLLSLGTKDKATLRRIMKRVRAIGAAKRQAQTPSRGEQVQLNSEMQSLVNEYTFAAKAVFQANTNPRNVLQIQQAGDRLNRAIAAISAFIRANPSLRDAIVSQTFGKSV